MPLGGHREARRTSTREGTNPPTGEIAQCPEEYPECTAHWPSRRRSDRVERARSPATRPHPPQPAGRLNLASSPRRSSPPPRIRRTPGGARRRRVRRVHLDGHDGRTASQSNGYGVMHLASNPRTRRCPRQANSPGCRSRKLAKDSASSNVLGASAVLDSYADRAGLPDAPTSGTHGDREVLAALADARPARLYTDEVYKVIGAGVGATAVSRPTRAGAAGTVGRTRRSLRSALGRRRRSRPPTTRARSGTRPAPATTASAEPRRSPRSSST